MLVNGVTRYGVKIAQSTSGSYRYVLFSSFGSKIASGEISLYLYITISASDGTTISSLLTLYSLVPISPYSSDDNRFRETSSSALDITPSLGSIYLQSNNLRFPFSFGSPVKTPKGDTSAGSPDYAPLIFYLQPSTSIGGSWGGLIRLTFTSEIHDTNSVYHARFVDIGTTTLTEYSAYKVVATTDTSKSVVTIFVPPKTSLATTGNYKVIIGANGDKIGFKMLKGLTCKVELSTDLFTATTPTYSSESQLNQLPIYPTFDDLYGYSYISDKNAETFVEIKMQLSSALTNPVEVVLGFPLTDHNQQTYFSFTSNTKGFCYFNYGSAALFEKACTIQNHQEESWTRFPEKNMGFYRIFVNQDTAANALMKLNIAALTNPNANLSPDLFVWVIDGSDIYAQQLRNFFNITTNSPTSVNKDHPSALSVFSTSTPALTLAFSVSTTVPRYFGSFAFIFDSADFTLSSSSTVSSISVAPSSTTITGDSKVVYGKSWIIFVPTSAAVTATAGTTYTFNFAGVFLNYQKTTAATITGYSIVQGIRIESYTFNQNAPTISAASLTPTGTIGASALYAS